MLPVLWLDWSAHRVTAGVDKVTGRRLGRLLSGARPARAATTKTRHSHWRELPAALADAIERSLPPRDDRDLAAPLFPGVTSTTLRMAIGRACRATAHHCAARTY